ncbi:uncharacterized protein LOC111046939 isoform X1 [Nilaparvata lugens]|uniref:uncharacterized protein LOC111046939 isoform X1 n=1 Tax=Nilaparvata lugens TaxID=108931 RepID=UPI00193DA2E9|nr:uncharacterized protein LOC111046939 isoform X1 [Nilaparvata lugens]
MAEKRRIPTFVPMAQKMEAIKRLENGEKISKIAKDMNVAQASLNQWRRLKSWFLQQNGEEYKKNTKRMKSSGYQKLNEAVYQWYLSQTEAGISVSGPAVQSKARQLFEELKGNGDFSFTASNGWLDNWKQQYKPTLVREIVIRQKKIPDPSKKKRHLNSVPMKQKIEALKRLENGEKVSKIAADLKVGKSTVVEWKRKKSKMESWFLQHNGAAFKRNVKRMKASAYQTINESVYEWYQSQTRLGIRLTGQALQIKALELFEELNNDGDGDTVFSASNGWLDSWKKRYGLSLNRNANLGKNISEPIVLQEGANAENAEEKQKQQMLRNIELSYPPVDSQFLTEDSNPSQTSESEPIASTSKLATLTSATVKPATVTSATVTSQVSQPKSLIQKSTVAEFSVIKKSTVDETAKLRETIKRLEEKNIQLQVENESYRVKNIMLETKQKKLIVQLKTIIQKKDPLYLGDSRLVYEQHSQRLTVSSASTTGSRTTTTLAGQGHDSDVGATQSQDFSDPDDPTDNTAFMDSLQPSDIDIDVGPIFETIEIKPNIELDNLPPPPPSPPPKRKRTAIPDIEVAEQEDPLATKRTRSSPLVGYGEDGDKEDDDNFSGDEFDEEEDGDKVRRAYQLLKSVFDKKDKYDIFGHRLAARLRALKSAKVCRHVLDIMESVIDDAEAGKYNNV